MRRLGSLLVLLAAAGLASGCAAPIVAGLTLNELSSATSIFSTALTGKGLGEHVLDIALDKDCRITEGVLRADRDMCEPRGSKATETDFKGLVGLMQRPAAVAAAPTGPRPDDVDPTATASDDLAPARVESRDSSRTAFWLP